MSRVAVIKAGETYEEIRKAVYEAIDQAGGLAEQIKNGDRVLIKPNIVDMPPERLNGAVTRWEVSAAAAEYVRECGGKPFIADSSSIGVSTRSVFEFCGYDSLKKLGLEYLDLKEQVPVTVPAPGGKRIKELQTWDKVAETDAVITVPVMKTHDQLEVTLGVKNIKGVIRDEQKKFLHKAGVVEGVVDVFQTVRPVFCITDATVGQEGFGPVYGNPVPLGLIVASRDTVACDAVSSAIMGLPADISPVTAEAALRNLGEIRLENIEIAGESIETVKRRFLRFSECGYPEGIPEFHFIVGENACTGCRDTMHSTLFQLKEFGTEQDIAGLNVVVGGISDLPEGCSKANTVLVGNCAGRHREKGEWVKGCPPNRVFIHQALKKLQYGEE